MIARRANRRRGGRERCACPRMPAVCPRRASCRASCGMRKSEYTEATQRRAQARAAASGEVREDRAVCLRHALVRVRQMRGKTAFAQCAVCLRSAPLVQRAVRGERSRAGGAAAAKRRHGGAYTVATPISFLPRADEIEMSEQSRKMLEVSASRFHAVCRAADMSDARRLAVQRSARYALLMRCSAVRLHTRLPPYEVQHGGDAVRRRLRPCPQPSTNGRRESC